MDLVEYIEKKIGLPKEIAQLIDYLFDNEEYLKSHQLSNVNSNSKKIYYIENGLLRVYYEKDGKDITHDFFCRAIHFAPIETVFLNQDFPYQVEFLEKSTIRTVDFSRIENYINENVKLQQFTYFIMSLSIKKLADRLYAIQFQSAQDRYKILLETYPDILRRVSLGHIASYLGITQSTLSVIRGIKSK